MGKLSNKYGTLYVFVGLFDCVCSFVCFPPLFLCLFPACTWNGGQKLVYPFNLFSLFSQDQKQNDLYLLSGVEITNLEHRWDCQTLKIPEVKDAV